jgi:hypothetical protein
MNTILFSILGVITLIGISYLFSFLSIRKGHKQDQRLISLKKKLWVPFN